MTMRTVGRRLTGPVLKPTLGLALGLAMVLGAWVALDGARPAAAEGHAEGASATFFGFVGATDQGVVPVRVRAVSADGATVCGTADVQPSSELLGFYIIEVAGEATKQGCPAEGEPVRFRLLFGMIDDNVWAAQEGLFQAGHWQFLHVSPAEVKPVTAGFSGALPEHGGIALLQWQGPDRTPVEQALAALGRPVAGIWRVDAEAGWTSYIPGAPDFTQSYLEANGGDLVLVRLPRE